MVSLSLLVLAAGAALVRASDSESSSTKSSSSAKSSSTSSSSSSSSSSNSSSSEPLTIVTPQSLVTCEPVLLDWKGGKAPYFLSVIPGNDPTGAPLVQFPEMNDTEYKWNVNLASGDSVTIEIKDSTGTINYAAALTITSGSDESCVNKSIVDPVTGSGTSSASGASTTGGSSTTSNTSSTSSSDTTTDEPSSAARLLAGGASLLAALGALAVAL